MNSSLLHPAVTESCERIVPAMVVVGVTEPDFSLDHVDIIGSTTERRGNPFDQDELSLTAVDIIQPEGS